MENLRRHEVRELARLTSHLSAAQQTFFQAEYGRHRRNPTTALLLCLLLGGFGAHYFYFGRHRGGVLRLLLCWTLVPLVMSLFEARTMTARALRYNASLANELVLALNGAVEETTGQMSSLVDAAPAALLVAAQPALAAAAQPSSAPQPAEPLAAAPSSAPQESIALAADVVAAGAAAPVDDAVESPATLPGSAEPIPVLQAVAATPSDGAAAAASPAPSPSADALDQATDPESRLIAAAWAGREPSADDPSDPPLASGELAATPSLPLWHTTPPPVDDQFSHLAPFAPEMLPDAPSSGSPSSAWPSPLPDPEWHDATSVAYFDDVPGEPRWQPAAALAASAPNQGPWPFADSEPAIPSQALAAAAWQSHDADPLLGEDDDLSRSLDPSGPFQDDLDAPAGAPVPVAWDRQREPFSDLAREDDTTVPDPVFMYQVAPQPRRAAVRLGPPPEALFHTVDSTPTDIPAWQTAPKEAARPSAASSYPSRGASTSTELAALGSALAAGLADLLRERPARPRTRPLTRPLPETTVPLPPAPSADSEPLPIVTPSAEPAPVPDAPPLSRAEPAPTPAIPPVSSADLQQQDNGIRESTALAPAAAYVRTPSRNLRRRVVQRVIVRKMAVLDGQVVAESTVERQVPVIADEAQMSARIREATTDAAREALQNLMAQAPEDALPTIRMQMYALDSASSVQGFRGADDHGHQ